MDFNREKSLSVKGFAVILMLFHHVLAESNLSLHYVDCGLLGVQIVSFMSYSGKICVSLFVFITGYGICKQMESQTADKRAIEKKSIRRYLKLESNFLFVYVLAIATSFLRTDGLCVYFEKGTLKGLAYMAIDSLGFAEFLQTPTYNETWWYMSIAVLFIFLTPILVQLYRKYGILLPICMFLFSLPQITVYHSANGVAYYWLSLMAGIIAAEENLVQKFGDILLKKNKPLAYTGGGIALRNYVCCEV